MDTKQNQQTKKGKFKTQKTAAKIKGPQTRKKKLGKSPNGKNEGKETWTEGATVLAGHACRQHRNVIRHDVKHAVGSRRSAIIRADRR